MSNDPGHLYESAARALAAGDWPRVVALCGQLLEAEPSHSGAIELLRQTRDTLRTRRTAPSVAPTGPAGGDSPAAGVAAPSFTPAPVVEASRAEQAAPAGQGVGASAPDQDAVAPVASSAGDPGLDAAPIATADAFVPSSPAAQFEYGTTGTVEPTAQAPPTDEAALAPPAPLPETFSRVDPDAELPAPSSSRSADDPSPDVAGPAADSPRGESGEVVDLADGLASARSALSAGRIDEAVALLEPLAEREPESADVLLLLAQARAHLGLTRPQAPLAEPAGIFGDRDGVDSGEWATHGGGEVGSQASDAVLVEKAAEQPAPWPGESVPDPLTQPLSTSVGYAYAPPPVLPHAPPAAPAEDRAQPRDGRRWAILGGLAVLVVIAFLGVQCLNARWARVPLSAAMESRPPAQSPIERGPEAPTTPAPTPAPAELFAECAAAMAADDWPQALTLCEGVRVRAPDQPGLSAALARIYLRLGQEELAHGGSPLVAQEYLVRAMEFFDQALAAPAPDAIAQQERELATDYQEGETALAAGDWPLAVQKLERVIASAPEYADGEADGGVRQKLHAALVGWGQALLKVGDYSGAEQHCARALDLAPASAAAAACVRAARVALAPSGAGTRASVPPGKPAVQWAPGPPQTPKAPQPASFPPATALR